MWHSWYYHIAILGWRPSVHLSSKSSPDLHPPYDYVAKSCWSVYAEISCQGAYQLLFSVWSNKCCYHNTQIVVDWGICISWNISSVLHYNGFWEMYHTCCILEFGQWYGNVQLRLTNEKRINSISIKQLILLKSVYKISNRPRLLNISEYAIRGNKAVQLRRMFFHL